MSYKFTTTQNICGVRSHKRNIYRLEDYVETYDVRKVKQIRAELSISIFFFGIILFVIIQYDIELDSLLLDALIW